MFEPNFDSFHGQSFSRYLYMLNVNIINICISDNLHPLAASAQLGNTIKTCINIFTESNNRFQLALIQAYLSPKGKLKLSEHDNHRLKF